MSLEDHFGNGSMLQRNERVKLAASFWNNIGAGMVIGGMATWTKIGIAIAGLVCIGTGFLLLYDEVPHLVTVRHVAEHFGNDPFLIRVNRYDRKAENIHVDRIRWYFDQDPTVDVAIIPFDVGRSSYSVRYIDDTTPAEWSRQYAMLGLSI
jgi:hypothetical protein